MDLAVGEYTVNLTTVVDGNHTVSTNSSKITVNPAPSAVEGKDVNITYGEDIIVPVSSVNATSVTYKIINSTGDVVKEGNLTVGQSITGLDLPVGNYTVNLTTVVDSNHTVSTNSSKITVNPVPTHISVGNVTAQPGDNVTIPIKVTADDKVPFNGNISVTLPDNTTVTVEIVNGAGDVNWTIPEDYKKDDYPVNASFEGNDTYLPSEGTGFVSVIPIDVQLNITVDRSKVRYGDVVEFTITVRNNGPGNATGTTVVNIIPKEFEYISDNCSDVNYQDTKDLLMAPIGAQSYDPSTGTWFIGDLASGEETKLTILARANFVGTKQVDSSVSIDERETNYDNNKDSTNVTVTQEPTYISVGNVTAKPGDNVTIPINVTTGDNVPFNGNVTVILPDGSNQTVEIVNGTGNVNWTVPDDYDGKFPVLVSFDGDNYYLPSNGTGIITVIPDSPSPEKHNGFENPVSTTKATGNPLMVLFIVLVLLGVNTRRKK